jgi:hypothetical protein
VGKWLDSSDDALLDSLDKFSGYGIPACPHGEESVYPVITVDRFCNLKLEKILLGEDKKPVRCKICRHNYGSTHSPCCSVAVCRSCAKKTDWDECPLCYCSICTECQGDWRQKTRCCGKNLCIQCEQNIFDKSNQCPYCKRGLCKKIDKLQKMVTCPVCVVQVIKKEYVEHLSAAHRTSEQWIQDYLFCPDCHIYVNPDAWGQHNFDHGNGYVRRGRAEAYQRMRTFQSYKRGGSARVLQVSEQCQVCFIVVASDDMAAHMLQDDHIFSPMETYWHRYCRRCGLYIRQDRYDDHH